MMQRNLQLILVRVRFQQKQDCPMGGGGSGDINVIQDGSADDGEGEVAPLDIPVSHVSISKKSNTVIYSEVSSMLRSIKSRL